jgi:hypothetical protein
LAVPWPDLTVRFLEFTKARLNLASAGYFFTVVKQILVLRKPIFKEAWPKLAFAGHFLPQNAQKTQKGCIITRNPQEKRGRSLEGSGRKGKTKGEGDRLEFGNIL